MLTVKCDLDGCKAEAPLARDLEAFQGGHPRVPDKWLHLTWNVPMKGKADQSSADMARVYKLMLKEAPKRVRDSLAPALDDIAGREPPPVLGTFQANVCPDCAAKLELVRFDRTA